MPDYNFIRICQPELLRLVPDELFTKVDTTPAMLARIKLFAPMILRSPTTLIYGAFDDTSKIHGILWAAVDIVSARVYVRIFSMDQSCQGGGLKKAMDFLFNEIKDAKIDKVLECCTARPEAFYRAGWKDAPEKHLIYEVNNEPVTDIKITAPVDPGANEELDPADLD